MDDNDNSIRSCPCYKDEESARIASWQCIQSAFDWTLLRKQEQESKNYLFDMEQPPWEDPSWPTITRYGSCEGTVGSMMDVEYMDQQYAHAKILEQFGTMCLTYDAIWLLLVFVLRGLVQRRNASRSSHLPSSLAKCV